MKYSYLIFLASLTLCTCKEEEPAYRLSSSGPDVTIEYIRQNASCPDGQLPEKYWVTFCAKRWRSKLCVENELNDSSITYVSSESFPLSFFSTYMASLSIWCNAREQYADTDIRTGPGELRKLEGVIATGGNRNAIITWQKPPETQYYADITDSVEITVCNRNSGHCLETTRSDGDSEEYSVERLWPGTEYYANLTACKEFKGKIYRSQPVSAVFVTDPPKPEELPPIGDFAVRVLKRERDVDLELTYSKPEEPSGADFEGVRIDVSDGFNSTVIENLRSDETIIAIRNLPYFAHFTIKARALWRDDNDDIVESVEVVQQVGTGTGVLPPAPKILEVTSISNHSALIRWSHEAHKSVEFSFNVTLGDGVMIEIEKSNRNYAIIDEYLEPDRLYQVSIISFLNYDTEIRMLASEQRQLKMLPRDALVPRFSVEDIILGNLQLQWNVTLPDKALDCYAMIELENLDEEELLRMLIRNITNQQSVRSSGLEMSEPRTHYAITMRTTCRFGPEIVVHGVSDTLEIEALPRPQPVSELDGNSPDGNSLHVSWTAGTLGNSYLVDGYEVQYHAVSMNELKTFDVQESKCTISDLEPSTEYNVTVIPYSMNDDDEKLLGPPTSKVFRTLSRAPPEATELTVYQVPLTRTIKISWKVAPYNDGRLDFHVTTRCGVPYDFWTNETSVEFKSREGNQTSTLCEVGVQTFNLASGERVFSRTVNASIDLQTLPPPVGASGVFVSDGLYKVKVASPPTAVKDLEYEVANGIFVDRFKTNEFVVSEKRFYKNVPYAVRLCVNDLCGSQFNFTISLNTGPPGLVRLLTLERIAATTVKVTWWGPMIRNGPIDGYFVDIRRIDDPNNVHTFKKSPGDRSLIFKAAKEYTIYEVAVRAFNYDRWDRAVVKSGQDVIDSIETRGTGPRPSANPKIL